MKKDIKRMLYTAVLIYIVLLAGVYLQQRSFMYFPDKNKPSPEQYGLTNVQVHTVTTEDGLDLNFWYIPPAASDLPVIVFFHGNAGHIGLRSGKAEILTSKGYGLMLAEYRGYGGNPGSPSEWGFYNDARAYLSWLQEEQSVQEQRIVLYGESIGSGVATQMAIEYPNSKALILETPFTSAIDIAKWRFFFLPVKYLMKDKFENVNKIGEFENPVLILHGTKDMIVPFRYGRALYEKANDPKTFKKYEAGGHNNIYTMGAGQDVIEFIAGLVNADDTRSSEDLLEQINSNEKVSGNE